MNAELSKNKLHDIAHMGLRASLGSYSLFMDLENLGILDLADGLQVWVSLQKCKFLLR